MCKTEDVLQAVTWGPRPFHFLRPAIFNTLLLHQTDRIKQSMRNLTLEVFIGHERKWLPPLLLLLCGLDLSSTAPPGQKGGWVVECSCEPRRQPAMSNLQGNWQNGQNS